MSKVITVDYEGNKYTMCYTRNSVVETERSGFIASEIAEKPFTMVSLLVRGAFLEKHPDMLPDTAELIYKSCPDKAELLKALLEMYNDVANTLIVEPTTKKASWKLTE